MIMGSDAIVTRVFIFLLHIVLVICSAVKKASEPERKVFYIGFCDHPKGNEHVSLTSVEKKTDG